MAAIYRAIAQDTNAIQDDATRRAVQRVANQLNEGQYGPKIGGVAITSSAAELNKLDGVSVTAAEMDYRAVTARLANVSAAKSVYVAIPYTGNITTIYAVLDGTTLAPTPDKFSFGTAQPGAGNISISGNVMTITTGTTAATGTSVTCTASAKAVSAGAILKISANGGSTGPAMNALFTVLIDIT